MNRKNDYGDSCPVLYAMNMIGGKWSLPILWKLKNGSLRYNQLKNSLSGITNIMLTRSLQDLEGYGLIKRIEHCVNPPHVDYELTEHALKLIPVLSYINEWGKEQLLRRESDENHS